MKHEASKKKKNALSRKLPPSDASRRTGKTIVLGRKLNSPADIKTLADLRRYFHIGAWDAIIVTDGSGTTWDKPIGWAAALIRKTDLTLSIRNGAASHGSNNVAEIMAALWPIFEMAEQDLGQKEGGYTVHVISDSQYVVKCLEGLETGGTEWATTYSSNRPLWLAMLGTVRKGLLLKGHFVPRDQLNFNQLCHDLANFSRLRIKQTAQDLKKAGWDLDNLLEG